jgi:hypothetical protein
MGRFEMGSECNRSASSPIRISALRIARGDDLALVRQRVGALSSLLMVSAVEARRFDRQGLSSEVVARVLSVDALATRLALEGRVEPGVPRNDQSCCRSTATSVHHLRVNAENTSSIEGRGSTTSMEPR